jgi:hypothetical protein
VIDHIKTLGGGYLSQIAGTPADVGPPSKGFVNSQAE